MEKIIKKQNAAGKCVAGVVVEPIQSEGGLFLFIVKDPVLPMILSGLTVNFILYEEDYGLAIARLCIVVSTFT